MLFQRNIERFCCSEREIQEEIQQIVMREFDEWYPHDHDHEHEVEEIPAALSSR